MAEPVYGTTVEHGDAATYAGSTVWTKLAMLRSITPPASEAEDMDTTHTESPDEFREFDPGLADGGEVELTILYQKSESEEVHALFRVKKGFRIKYPGGGGWKLNGYIKSIGDEGDLGDVYETNITIKVSGKPVPDETV